jgi:hypothetical protein
MTPHCSGVRRAIGASLLAGVLALAGCTGTTQTNATKPAPTPATAVSLPPEHGKFSYQIGGAYPAPSGVQIVDRDRSDKAVSGVYSICYLNAFQAQTDDLAWWTQHHPSLLLRQPSGSLVIDKEWDEALFDISTAAKRAALLTVVGGWIDGCATSGYRGVEPDNLDSYNRSQGLLTAGDALAFSTLLAARAHHDHLAIAQKNASDLAERGRRAGFDFAITEECQVFSECDAYTAVYGRHIIEIEYTDNPSSAFTTACKLRGKTTSVVLRDREVTPSGQPHYVEKWCSS